MEESNEALLKQLGLSEYEAKACMVLVIYGKSDANKISSIGSIPLPRVYDTMENLAKKGLVSISRTRPQTFNIINLKRFFEILKVDEKRRIEDRIKKIDEISGKFFKTISAMPKPEYQTSEKELLISAKRSGNVEEIWNNLHAETKKEFFVFAGDVSWINRRFNEIKKLTRKNILYRIIWFKCQKEFIPNIKKAIKAGAELRCYNDATNDLRAIISDDKKVYLIEKLPKPGVNIRSEGEDVWAEEFANYTGTLITSRTIAKVFEDYFKIMWEKSTPSEEILKKFGE